MPYNPAGLFSLVASYLAQPGAAIRTEQHNPVFEDVAAGMSSVLLRDGRAPMTGPLNMNNFPINNIAAGSSPSSVATLAQAMPIGAVIDFAGSTAPAGWSLCFGQAVSRTTFATLFDVIGTTYGTGDGSTTFNLPDARGRVAAGKDDMGGVAATRLDSATTLGSSQGEKSHTLTAPESAQLTFTSTVTDPGHAHTYDGAFSNNPGASGGQFAGQPTTKTTASAKTGITVETTSNAGGGAHNNVQPTIIMNKIIRVSFDG